MSAIGKICNCVMLVYNGARCVHIYELYAVKQVQKYVIRLLILYSWQMLFARALCERCRVCIIRCTFVEFPQLTPSLLVMGADLANFAWFTGVVGELREIWLIHSNFPGFSVDGQRSETSELNID